MKNTRRLITLTGATLIALIGSQTGTLSAFNPALGGASYVSNVGHLAERGTSDSWATAWTYARYYGGAFYGGGPDRKNLAVTIGQFTNGTWEGPSQYQFDDNTTVAETYVSTGSLFSSATYQYANSWVDTDVDIGTDPTFDPVVGTLEAIAAVMTH